MDFRLGDATKEELAYENDETSVGVECVGCGYEIWIAVRDNVPTQVKCFRGECSEIMIVTYHTERLELQ